MWEPDGALLCASACLLARLLQTEAQRSLPGRSQAQPAARPARKSPPLKIMLEHLTGLLKNPRVERCTLRCCNYRVTTQS